MITKEDLETAATNAANASAPYKEQFEKTKKEYEEKCKELHQPFISLLEKYYDENLVDINGDPVRVGDIITLNKAKLKVVKRRMQSVLGEMLMNPRVHARHIRINGDLSVSEYELFPSDLKHYIIINHQ